MNDDKLEKYVTKPYRKTRTFYHSQTRFVKARGAFYRKVVEHKPESILDVGCGTGLDSWFIQSQGIEYVGIDPIEGNIKEARINNPDAEFKQGYIQELPFPDNSFDWIWLCTVWELLPSVQDMEKGINECIRVARRRIYALDATAKPKNMVERYMSIPMNLGLTFKRVHYDPVKQKANYLWIIDLEGI